MTHNRFPGLLQRALVLAITGFFWVVWLYLLAPLASLLLWVLGIRIFVTEMFERGGYPSLMHEIAHYGTVALAILGTVVAWMIWNKQRYGNRNTRKMQPLYVSVPELSEFSGVKASVIRRLQAAKQATVSFDDKSCLLVQDCRGKIVAVKDSKDQKPINESRP